MNSNPVNIAVLVSGNGTNFQAIVDALEAGRIPNGRIACLVSNRPDAFALNRAKSTISLRWYWSTKVFPTGRHMTRLWWPCCVIMALSWWCWPVS